MYFIDKIINQMTGKTIVLINKCFPYVFKTFPEFLFYLNRFCCPGIKILLYNCFSRSSQKYVHTFKSKPASDSSYFEIIAFYNAASQSIGNFQSSFRIYKRIAIPVSAGPKPHFDNWIVIGELIREIGFLKKKNSSRCGKKYIFQIPDQAHCFIIRRWFFFFKERRFAQLLQVHIDLAGIIFMKAILKDH